MSSVSSGKTRNLFKIESEVRRYDQLVFTTIVRSGRQRTLTGSGTPRSADVNLLLTVLVDCIITIRSTSNSCVSKNVKCLLSHFIWKTSVHSCVLGGRGHKLKRHPEKGPHSEPLHYTTAHTQTHARHQRHQPAATGKGNNS